MFWPLPSSRVVAFLGRPAARTVGLVVAVLMLAAACTGETADVVGERTTAADDAVAVPTLPSVADIPLVEVTPTPEPTPEGPVPLRVVTLMGESGVMEQLDRPAVAGVLAQVDALNDGGGLLGRPISVERIDTESRLSRAERLAEGLQRNPPDLLVLSCDVEFSAPVLELADKQGWLTISPCADDTGYANGTWGSRNFTLGAPAAPRGALAAQVALDRYGDTAMVLRDVTSPEALRFCDGFERAFRELGGNVVYRDEFSYDTLEPLRDRVEERGRQTSFIVVCSHVPGGDDAAPNIINAVRNLGFLAPIVSGSTLDEPTWFSRVPVLGELTFVSWSSTFGNDPSTQVNALIDAANSDPNSPRAGVSTVLGADAIGVWARAVEAAGSDDATTVAAALAAFSNQPILTGELSFTGGSRMDISRTYRIVNVVDGEVRPPELAAVEG